MRKILVKETASTNTYLLDALREGEKLAEWTVCRALQQTAGRGQTGNRWESEPGRNLTFSVLLRPEFLPAREQFLLSEVASLAVVRTLASCLASSSSPASQKKCTIKWPNDVYIGHEKVCGMLIENSLMGAQIANSVVGIGINLNQTQWTGGAPNPTSLKLCCQRDFAVDAVLDAVLELMAEYYALLRDGRKTEIHREYIASLYRRDGFFPYKDPATGRAFEARIADVEPAGQLVLEEADGAKGRYGFKEVMFVLPCGVTKE